MTDDGRARATEALRAAGCIAAEEEAAELLDAAGGDRSRLEELVRRRCTGEPLAWLTGAVRFCGERVLVRTGVYVPRWQSQPLVHEASARLPDTGVAVDLCTGSGAIAAVLRRARPAARVLATEIDPVAVACARANGVEVFEGDLTSGLPASLAGAVDVMCAVAPYVPADEMHLLPRDVRAYEPRRALDGGTGGTEVLERVVAEASSWLRPGGSLCIELGGDQASILEPCLLGAGFDEDVRLADEDGDLRGLVCRFSGRRGANDATIRRPSAAAR